MKKDGARLRSLLIGGIAFTGLASLAAVSAWAHPASQHGKDEVFKIGFVGPITGPNAAIGIGIRNSLELRINQANERGELPFKLEFVPETDDSKPAVGVAAVQKLCSDDKIIAASSHWNSPVAIATNPYYKDCGLLNLIPGTGSNKITEMGFTAIGRTATAYKFVLPYLGDKAANVLGLKSMALIHSRDDYGTDQTDEFQANYEASGGKVVAREGYNVGDRDFTAILTKIRASKPEGIFHGGLFTEGALIAKQMRQLGMKQL